jgi:serine/threonine protein kinase
MDTGFISDIADGLSALHRCGVIHGDLKPENILLFEEPSGTGNLVAKLNDFGLSNVSVTDDVRRGRSMHWDAPECLDTQGIPRSASLQVMCIHLA